MANCKTNYLTFLVAALALLGPAVHGSATAQPPEQTAQRHVLENEAVRLVFDHLGRLVEIFNKETKMACTAATKPSRRAPLFLVEAYSANRRIFLDDPLLREGGGFSYADPALLYSTKPSGDLQRLTADAEHRPQIAVAPKDGVPTLTGTCRLSGGIDLTWTVSLPDKSGASQWRIHVRNTADVPQRQHLRVFRVAFPILPNLCVGGRPADNVLARTYVQGELIPNPSQHSFTRPGRAGRFTNVLTYPGWASMPWMDLYIGHRPSAIGHRPEADSRPPIADSQPPATGLYFASYDPTYQQTDIEAVPDAQNQTVTLGMRTLAFLEPGEQWKSQTFVVATHQGDWHWAADRYRADSAAWFKKRDVPEWVQLAHGWFGTGVPNYQYAELPKMLEQARWLGLDYLQCWSQMLENVGPNKKRKAYYCFFLPDPDRGGEKEMEAGVKKVREMGGHIGFYSNFWTWDADAGNALQQWKEHIPPGVKIPHWTEFRNYMSVWPDGHLEAGDYDNGYAGACPGAKGWRDYLRFWVIDKYVKEYGVDAWYFDSFPVTMFGAARICFSPHHGDGRPHGVGPHLVDFARLIRDKADPLLLSPQGERGQGKLAVCSESVGDVFMQYNSHALGLELIDGLTQYQSPQVYTYTFPHHLIFSGSCNGAGSGLKYYYPDVQNAGSRQDTLNRVFLLGYRFDILGYGYNQANPDMLHLRGLIAIREKIKDHWYRSSFKDEIGLGKLPEKVYAKLFRHDQGRSLTVALVDRREKKSPFTLTVDAAALDLAGLQQATMYTLDGKEAALQEAPLVLKARDGVLAVEVPSRQAAPAAIVIGK